MSARPGAFRRRRASATVAPPAAQRRQPLPPGQLAAMALTHMRAHPGLDFSPGELANALGRPKSRGAIIRACQQFTAHGLVIRTQDRPQRYRAAAWPHGAPPGQGRGIPREPEPDTTDGLARLDPTPQPTE